MLHLSKLSGLAILLVSAAICAAAENRETPKAAAETLARYQSVPKGVVLEDGADGMEVVRSLAYDSQKNVFTINNAVTYANPVARKEFQKIVKSIYKDDRVGVTLISGEPTMFGSFSTEEDISKNLSETDKLMGGVLYGIERLLTGVRLPGDYKPVRAINRKIPVIAVTTFHQYAFTRMNSAYVRNRCSIDVTLIPLSTTETTSSGGHLPDGEASKIYAMEDSDRINIAHLKAHEAEYCAMQPFKQTVAYGEAAAFARHLRDCKMKLDDVLASMK